MTAKEIVYSVYEWGGVSVALGSPNHLQPFQDPFAQHNYMYASKTSVDLILTDIGWHHKVSTPGELLDAVTGVIEDFEEP